MGPETISTYAFRLKAGDDLKKSIVKFLMEKQFENGWVASCVGSLNSYSIRFANRGDPVSGTGYYEILSLNGTLSRDGVHLHICISNSKGQCMGGHLAEGCIIYTTAEIVLQTTTKYGFTRELDPGTGWSELFIKENKPA